MAGVAMMVRDKYTVRLTPEQREELRRLIRVGKSTARVSARVRILLKSDDGWPAPRVAEGLDVALSTVYRVKQRFSEDGLAGVLKDRPQAHRPRKLDDRGEARLIALARRQPGMATGPCAFWRARWWSWGWRLPCPTRGCESVLKKRSQAVAEAGVAHPPGERRVCGPHGGRLGPVPGTP